MQKSSYPSIRKFYTSLRAVQQLYYAYGTNVDKAMLREADGANGCYLLESLKDENMPFEEIYEACQEGIKAYQGTQNLSDEIEKALSKKWSNESGFWLLKGQAYTEKAWNARGHEYAYKVTDKGWELFRDRLAIAEKALARAWELNPNDPRIALQMITVELGQGQGRDYMELWFKRAMMLDPNDYDACISKLFYLEPKWYGSRESMIEFGLECVSNANWGGRVPLVLVDAHWNYCRGYIKKSEQGDYWKQAEVWQDIKSAFDRFFELNPDAVDYYRKYAWYAYHAEQWDKLNDLLTKLGPYDYDYFGGKAEFDKMVQLAKNHVSNPH